MKKLALVIATVCMTAAPVLACPHSGESDEVKTVDKADTNKDKPTTDTAKNDKAKPADKAKAEKPKADPKTAKPADPKKPDKVSSN